MNKKTLAKTIEEALEDARKPENQNIIKDDEDLSHFLAGWLRGAVNQNLISDWRKK